MTDIGESVAVAVTNEEKEKLGSIKVSVRDICTGERIPGATVTIGRESKNSDDSGEASFDKLPLGTVSIKVKKHYEDKDYVTFLVHYPKVLRNHDAKSSLLDSAEINKESGSKFRAEIVVYKLIDKFKYHRRHIDLRGDDKYGHWWTVVDANTSFGWWPKYPLGAEENQFSEPPEPPAALAADATRMQKIQHAFKSAVYEVHSKLYNLKDNSLTRTLGGVEGELNGVTSFGGISEPGKYKDPHAAAHDEGDEVYQPVRNDCFELSDIKKSVIDFALGYTGSWSWRFEAGNHCHTFQKKLMVQCKLDKVKVIK